MTITHVVLFLFKEGIDPHLINNACNQVIALKQNCIHPVSDEPYIISFRGGKDNSPEGMQYGMTHAFVAEFKSAADRDYYVSKDPVHLALNQSIGQLIEKAQVVDFTDDVHV
ncbi:MAG: hypothetical protein M1836_004128 [Candelina mexicana]|nr:MAG: hypothetical protein M1836_004128 [Candelina mexicana]